MPLRRLVGPVRDQGRHELSPSYYILRPVTRDLAGPKSPVFRPGPRRADDRRIAVAAIAVAVGYLVYAGLLRIPLRWFFTATGVLVLFLAAGMASQAARFLVQADILPSLASPVWDTSRALPQSSVAGTLLHSLVGYDARPAGMQIVFYVSVLVAVAAGMILVGKSAPSTHARKGTS